MSQKTEKKVNDNENISHEINENVSYETLEKIDKKSDDIFTELKEIKDKLADFELSDDEQEDIIKGQILEEEKENKSKIGGGIFVLVGVALLCVLFWDKINDKIQKKQDSNI